MKKLFAVVFLITVVAAISFAQQKFALVIGNGAYSSGLSKLNNPINDANDVTAALQGLGFTVDKVLDGKQNTELIIAELKRKGESGKAAQLCVAYTLNGYRDWFLPSKDELHLMYKNLKQRGLGGFGDGWYWSSSQYTYYNAWSQRFSDGGQGYDDKGSTYSVRAVRAF